MPYIPSLHTVSNKPYGAAQSNPTDARSWYYVESDFVYRPYQNEAEVVTYLDTAKSRGGQFSIIINTGELQPDGITFIGGENTEWWFKDGIADEDLVPKIGGVTYTVDNGLSENPSGNFQLGGAFINDQTTIGTVPNLYIDIDSTETFSKKIELGWYHPFMAEGAGVNTRFAYYIEDDTDLYYRGRNALTITDPSSTTAECLSLDTIHTNSVDVVSQAIKQLSTSFGSNSAGILMKTGETDPDIDFQISRIGTTNGVTLSLPTANVGYYTGYIPISVNGNLADDTGNITVSGDGIYTANNGLTDNASTFQLGGPLIQGTEIAAGENFLTISGGSGGSIFFTVNGGAGVSGDEFVRTMVANDDFTRYTRLWNKPAEAIYSINYDGTYSEVNLSSTGVHIAATDSDTSYIDVQPSNIIDIVSPDSVNITADNAVITAATQAVIDTPLVILSQYTNTDPTQFLTTDSGGHVILDTITTPDLQAVTDAGEKADNNIILHPVAAPTSHTVPSKGQNVVSGSANVLTGSTSSVVTGTGNVVSGDYNIVTGKSVSGTNTISGDSGIMAGVDSEISKNYSACIGSTNLVRAPYSLCVGRINTIDGTGSEESNFLFGIQNHTAGTARWAIALGMTNYTNNDGSTAIGYGNYAGSKASLALGYNARTKTFDETALGHGYPLAFGATASAAGDAQTSIIGFTATYVGVGTANFNLIMSDCRDASGNEQSGCSAFGFSYYEVPASTVYYIQGRFTGISQNGHIAVYTIDTYFKNVGGTITAGTLNFTQVVKETDLNNMTGVTLNFSTISGTTKGLTILYATSSFSVQARFMCVCTINKIKYV